MEIAVSVQHSGTFHQEKRWIVVPMHVIGMVTHITILGLYQLIVWTLCTYAKFTKVLWTPCPHDCGKSFQNSDNFDKLTYSKQLRTYFLFMEIHVIRIGYGATAQSFGQMFTVAADSCQNCSIMTATNYRYRVAAFGLRSAVLPHVYKGTFSPLLRINLLFT